MEARFHEATWVGFNGRSNEHIVVLSEGGPAIKVRTVRPRPESERWKAGDIDAIMGTPWEPSPAGDLPDSMDDPAASAPRIISEIPPARARDMDEEGELERAEARAADD